MTPLFFGIVDDTVKLQHKHCCIRYVFSERAAELGLCQALYGSGQLARVTKAVSWWAVGVDKAEG